MPELPLPEDDGLTVPEVGEWSRDKHHFLWRYICAFTTSMRNKPWAGLHYIDLFAGAGVARLRDSGRLEWGSPLLAAQSPHPFSALHVCELGRDEFSALKQRLARVAPDLQVQAVQGDANQETRAIVQEIPQGALSLAFLDPNGLHLHFEMLRVLAAKRVDLIIFFPDHLDALRNWEHHYHGDPDSNLDRVLGPGADWRAIRKATTHNRWAEELASNPV